MDYRLVLTTCPDRGSAEALAEHLVGERLAACVNLVPGLHSVYRWRGETVKEQEVLLLIKSSKAAYPALERAILALHPYEVPEVLALPVDEGAAPYLAWIDEQLKNE